MVVQWEERDAKEMGELMEVDNVETELMGSLNVASREDS